MKKDVLQGAWNVVTLEVNGQKMPAGAAQVVVKGSRFTTTGMGATYRGTLRVDTKVTPHTLDMVFTAGPEKGNTNRGIFEIDGDTWKLCLNMTGGARPTAFATKPGSGLALETLQRQKAIRRASAAPRPVLTPVPELGGEWSMVSMVNDGRALPAEFVKMGKRVAIGNTVTVSMGGKVVMKADFTVDRSQQPNHIDYWLKDGQTQQGVFELKGQELRVIFAAPGKSRPADFSTASGDGKTRTVWKLRKKA